jgi:integrase
MPKKLRWSASEIKEFCGWEFLEQMAQEANRLKTKLLIAAAFLTGGRINEVLALERKHFAFDIDPKMVVVKSMPVEKRYEKIGQMMKWRCMGHCQMRWGTAQRPNPPTDKERQRHKIVEYLGWETRRKSAYRTFPFPKSELLVAVLQEQLPQSGPLFDFGYDVAYKEVTTLGRELGTWIPTHWFRSQRASQLAFEYGFAEHDLIEWFLWRDYMTAFNYARKGYKGLAMKMVKA